MEMEGILLEGPSFDLGHTVPCSHSYPFFLHVFNSIIIVAIRQFIAA